MRGGEFFNDLSQALQELKADHIPFEILFLEAANDVLVRRFKESRRRHPLDDKRSLLEAIQLERDMLEELRGQANVVVDTSILDPRQLKEKLYNQFSQHETNPFTVNLVSFGYKAGIPMDSDLVIDVRFLTNPYYDPVMRTMTGVDRPVIDYVLESPVTKSFTRRFLNLLKFLIPHYIKEGKTNSVSYTHLDVYKRQGYGNQSVGRHPRHVRCQSHSHGYSKGAVVFVLEEMYEFSRHPFMAGAPIMRERGTVLFAGEMCIRDRYHIGDLV